MKKVIDFLLLKLFVFIMGERVEGCKINPPSFKTVMPDRLMEYNEWNLYCSTSSRVPRR